MYIYIYIYTYYICKYIHMYIGPSRRRGSISTTCDAAAVLAIAKLEEIAINKRIVGEFWMGFLGHAGATGY